MSIKKPFKSLLGFDSNGEPVVNVGYPREAENNDAVNVEYFIDGNTVQNYDETRGYKAGFVVIREGRFWSATSDITSPSGAFDADLWDAVRTDTPFKRATQGVIAAQPGDRYLIKPQSSELEIQLPTNPLDGEVVAVQDEGGFISTIKTSVTSSINIATHGNEYLITKGLALYIFVFNGVEWIVSIQDRSNVQTLTAGTYQLTAGEKIYRRTSTGQFVLTMPRYAEDGDVIEAHDMDGLASINSTVLQVHPQSTSTLNDSTTTEVILNTIGWGALIYDKNADIWRVFDADVRTRTHEITSDYTTKPLEHISVRHTSPSSVVNITLPKDANDGDFIEITNTYSYDGAELNVQVDGTTTHTILGDINKYIKNKFSDVPNTGQLQSLTSVSLPNDFCSPAFRLSYDESNEQWIVDVISYRVDQVDENYRDRPGIAKLADQTEVNKNHEDAPIDDAIVTPLTLANRTSTTTRRGLSRLATSGELQVVTDGTFANDAIVTPELLNSRQATETIRGLAEVATVSETADNANDTHIITPLKLDSRRATTTLAGITELSDNTEVDAGTNASNIITPSNLMRWTRTSANGASTQSWRGSVRTATKGETWLGNMVDGSTRLVDDHLHSGYTVTPRTLAYALGNYLPMEAKAVDSDLLDGLDSAQFLRSDVEDRLEATLTITEDKGLVFNNGTDTETFSLLRSVDGDVRLTGVGQSFRIGDTSSATFVPNFSVDTDGEISLGYNGTTRLITTATGVDITGDLNVTDMLVSGEIIQDGLSLDDTYVKQSGDDMIGDLNITKESAAVTLTGTVLNAPRYNMVKPLSGGGNLYQRSRLSDGRLYWESSTDGTTWTEQMAVTPSGTLRTSNGYAVNSTTVIESDALINWNKLKAVPNATTTQQGIVQLNNTVDSTSQTQAATANVIRILKEQLDEKAGISGTEFDDITVNNYIQIGNVRIEPDPENETVKFTWVENP